ncbi:hypothetical protein B0H13DRAFT_2116217, partial [Mycena leptocephala]
SDKKESVSHPREQLSPPEQFEVTSLSALRQIGERGSMVKILKISLVTANTMFPAKMLDTTSFSIPPPGFCVLPHLERLSYDGCSPILLDILQPLPLNLLRDVELSKPINVPAAVAFLKCHGVKLRTLSSTPEILSRADVFNLCTNLTTLKVTSAFDFAPEEEARLLPDNFIACSIPHSALAKIHFGNWTIAPYSDWLKREDRKRLNEGGFKQFFEQLKPESFPVLNEIQIDEIKWPTSEQEARQNQWIPLSDVLRRKGIKVIDCWTKRSGPTGVRALILPPICGTPI